MKYIHITLDVGAAIKAFYVISNQPYKWKDVLIHLGDYHAMMEFFSVVGQFITGSGFEEIAYQAGV